MTETDLNIRFDDFSWQKQKCPNPLQKQFTRVYVSEYVNLILFKTTYKTFFFLSHGRFTDSLILAMSCVTYILAM